MQYELINPSDPYTFIADSKEIAALTVFVLGTQYGASPQEGDENIPIFLFGGSREWYINEFNRTPDEGIEVHRKAIAEALLSFMYGHFEDRRRYEAALKAITDDEKREEFIKEWQDGHGSINDIGTFAHETGKKILEKLNTD